MEKSIKKLHQLINTHFNLEEFRTLCFNLGVPFDDLGGEGLSSKIRELILFMERHQKLELMIEVLNQERPKIFNNFQRIDNFSKPIEFYQLKKNKWEQAKAKYLSRIYDQFRMTRILGNPRPLSLEDIFIDIYGYNNPVKYTDPTGHYVVDSDDGEISPPIPVVENNVEEGTHEEGTNYVDITEWLIWQMKWNSQGEDAEILRGYTTLYPDGDRSLAWSKWRDLVKNGSKWDFKPQFRAQSIGYVYIDGIPVRMDIVANIHYGFVGNQVGFTNLELHLGAGIAQQTSGDKAKGDWTYYGDEPADFWAIEFGIHLSRTYGLDVTYDEFIYSFNLYLDAGKFDAYLPPFA